MCLYTDQGSFTICDVRKCSNINVDNGDKLRPAINALVPISQWWSDQLNTLLYINDYYM